MDTLDQRIESDLRLASIVFEASYAEQIIAGIAAIGEINQVTNARIQTDTRIAAARIASHAEVSCIELLSTAELAVLKIDQLKDENADDIQIQNEKEIDEIGKEVRLKIEGDCEDTIQNINKYSEMIINLISENSKEAITKIQNHVAEVRSQIKENEKAAEEKFKASKDEDRTHESIESNAEQAKQKIITFAKEVTGNLANLSSDTMADINKRSQEALDEITNIFTTAEIKVKKMKDVALSRLRKMFE